MSTCVAINKMLSILYVLLSVPSPDLSFQPGEHLEVYVSASENPQHFWIQIIGVRSLQLDKLTTEMSRFYNGDTSNVSLVHFSLFRPPRTEKHTWLTGKFCLYCSGAQGQGYSCRGHCCCSVSEPRHMEPGSSVGRPELRFD